MIPIDQIRTDGGTQSRAAINEATVAEYAEAMADPNTVFPPLTVYFDGRDYWLADGFHRLEAGRRIGRVEMPADVRQGDRRRAILHSVAANSAHGLRRSNEDKRRAVLTLLEDDEWSRWSDRAIAEACRVSVDLVQAVRTGLTIGRPQVSVREADAIRREQDLTMGRPIVSEPRTYVTKHGTEAVMKTAKIGRPRAAAAHPEAAPEPEPPAIDPAEAKLRRDLAKLTPEALIEDVIGLRAQLAEERARRREVQAQLAEIKDQIAALTDGDDMGRKLGLMIERERQAKARLVETQAQLARETRRANAMEKARDHLQRQLESQIIPMDGAA